MDKAKNFYEERGKIIKGDISKKQQSSKKFNEKNPLKNQQKLMRKRLMNSLLRKKKT